MNLAEVFRNILNRLFLGRNIYKEFTWQGAGKKSGLNAAKGTKEIMGIGGFKMLPKV